MQYHLTWLRDNRYNQALRSVLCSEEECVSKWCLWNALQLDFYTKKQMLSLITLHITLSVCPQVTLKAGRTSLSPGTPTTWWEPTVFLCSLTTFKDWPPGVMLLNVEAWWIKWRWCTHPQTHTRTNTHWQTRSKHTHSKLWSMKKIQSVLFTAPVDEGKTVMIRYKLFFKLCPNLKFWCDMKATMKAPLHRELTL